MDVLISWSGRESKGIAEYLRSEWLPTVVPDIQPWVSSLDIDKGKRWFGELSGQLDKSQDVIVVVTPSNVNSPWIYYEVGRVEGHSPDSSIYPYLIGVEFSQLSSNPLSGFQMIRPDKDDTLQMLQSINKRLSQPHNAGLLDGNFRSHWSKLERRIDKVITQLGGVEEQITEIEQAAELQLNELATSILLNATGSSGSVTTIPTHKGLLLDDGGKQGDMMEKMIAHPREKAEVMGALDDLASHGLLRKSETDSELAGIEFYLVTREGYRVADMLPRESDTAPTDGSDAGS